MSARCALCGYALRGLAVYGRCPECGHPIVLSLEEYEKRQISVTSQRLRRYRSGLFMVALALVSEAVIFLGCAVFSEWSGPTPARRVFFLLTVAIGIAAVVGTYQCAPVRLVLAVVVALMFFTVRVGLAELEIVPWANAFLAIPHVFVFAAAAGVLLRSLTPFCRELGAADLERSCRHAWSVFLGAGSIAVALSFTDLPSRNSAPRLPFFAYALIMIWTSVLTARLWARAGKAIPAEGLEPPAVPSRTDGYA